MYTKTSQVDTQTVTLQMLCQLGPPLQDVGPSSLDRNSSVSVMVLRAIGDKTIRLSRVLVKIMWIWGEISIISPADTRIPLKERTGTAFRKRI